MPSEHKFETSRNYKSPLFWIIVFAFLYVFIRQFFDEFLGSYGFAMQKKTIDVDEDLPNLFHAVTMLQAQTPVKTNDLCKERYGFEF